MSDTPMAQPMRALLGAMNALAKLNLGPTLESFMAKPYAERIANKNPGLMTRRVNAMIDTEDAHVEGRGGPIHTAHLQAPRHRPWVARLPVHPRWRIRRRWCQFLRPRVP